MGALRLTLRAELRRRWRPMLGLALLLGVIGGVVLTAAAGAERTDTAYPRLLRWANAAQADVIVNQAPVPAFFAALRHLPEVAAVSTGGLFNFTLPVRHGPPVTPVETFSSPDDSMGRTGDRLKMLDGQLPDPTRPDAAVIDQDLATREQQIAIATKLYGARGSSPWPGMDCAGVPRGTCATAGAPGAVSTWNASSTWAATPGRSSYPSVRASSRTEPRSVAVRRYPSVAIRSE